MNRDQIDSFIGKDIMVNGIGDLSMTHKSWVGKSAKLIKLTKAGLLYIQSLTDEKQFTSIPMKNVDKINE